MKLNLGCGRNILDGYINVDNNDSNPEVTFSDLEALHCLDMFDKDSIDEFLLSHVLEHINTPLDLFESMYLVAKPGALCIVKCPYGSSDDADEDPTHVRRLFFGSFGYFGQPYYWRADYGYVGDWQVKKVILAVDEKYVTPSRTPAQVIEDIDRYRNTVIEMVAQLVAIKPAREQKKELQETPEIEIVRARRS